jgi:hypothetical protein
MLQNNSAAPTPCWSPSHRTFVELHDIFQLQSTPSMTCAVPDDVQITDKCPECESNHIDLQALIWAKVQTGNYSIAILLLAAQSMCNTKQHLPAISCNSSCMSRHGDRDLADSTAISRCGIAR